MKKIIISFLLITSLIFSAYSQGKSGDTRTRETKIADIVMLLPANNSAQYTQLMSDLSQLGDVIADLAPRLANPGGNDAQVRYAISGLTMYASKDNTKKIVVAKSLCAVIPQVESDEIRDFLLIQLQYVAGSESVETVTRYISNERLCDAALRVLVRINNDAANQAMFDALKKSTGIQQMRLVQALGYTRYQPAADAIAALAGSNNVELQKVVLHSLAEIASPDSKEILENAVKKAGYVYEPTDALGSYILYLKNSLPGQEQNVSKAAKNMLKSTSEKNQLAAKTAALELIVLSSGDKAVNDVMSALNSDSKPYREAALKYSSGIQSQEMYNALMKKAKSEKQSDLKAAIVSSLGLRGNKAAMPFILDCLKGNDSQVIDAAIVASGKLDEEKAVTPIIHAMNGDNKEVVETGKKTLLTFSENTLIEAVATAIPKAPVLAKIAFIEILAEKKAQPQSAVIFDQTGNTDAKVRLAAKQALKTIVNDKDIFRISGLLNTTTSKDEITALQEALYAAVASTDKSKQVQLISDQMDKSKQPALYYNVLAMVGGEQGLEIVKKGFKSDNASVRSEALDALTHWSDASALGSLYQIASDNPVGIYFDKALLSYIDKVGVSKNTPEQKLLLLRKASGIANTSEQKQQIIHQIAKTSTFLGLITVGQYLDDTNDEVQQATCQAIRSIALSHPEYFGSEVVDLLNKATAMNKDPEAAYQKQAVLKHIAAFPKETGFVSMFNGKNLTGWKGLVENPIARAKMSAKQLDDRQKKSDDIMRRDWKVENGLLVFEGKGYDNLCSEKSYGDFELYVDWRIAPEGDAGIYLRGTPQVQIWDTALVKVGAQVGSGGLYNNQKHQSTPLVVADNAVEEWNSFYIKMVGEKVTVYLNGQLVTDNVTLENYWNRAIPIFPKDAIELQAHGTRVEYRDIYVREIPRPAPYEVSPEEKAQGFVPMFNGIDMSGWIGNLKDYVAQDRMIVCDSQYGGTGNLYTEKEYADFVMRFEFQLTPAANNGLGIRTPLEGDAAYVGMELQILDNEAPVYKDLQVYQYHGSVYGVIPAKRGYQKSVGEWNTEEVIAKGNRITVTLNGEVILDGDISEASKGFTQTLDGKNHPGLSNKSGHIGFLGHGSEVKFRNLRIKEIPSK